MKKILIAFLFLIMFLGLGITSALASTIPDAELKILKESFPKLNVRFDGVVELKDGTSYIPVYPIGETKVDKVQVKQTIPANKTFKDKPDFIMFNTNFALFKLIKNKDKSTIINNKAIPYEVKMGILPQDLLVPAGFQIPEDYRIIIGDLLIPIIPTNEYKDVPVSQIKQADSTPKFKLLELSAQQLANKYFYATSFNSTALSILNADTGRAFKQIDFLSIPSDIKLTNNGRYLLVSTIRNGKVFVVDTVKTNALKEIKAGEKPFFIAISDLENKAYVANRGDNTISVIDIPSMQLREPIKVTGNPCYIDFSTDGQKMYYLDAVTGTVYYLEKVENYYKPYSANPLFRANNISKIQVTDDKIYTLDRGENKLIAYYFEPKPEEEETVNASDITPVNYEKPGTKKTNVVDYNSYSEPELTDIPFEEKEKLTPKQVVRKEWRRLLYFPEDYAETEQPLNPENQVVVFGKEEPKKGFTVTTEDEDGVIIEEEYVQLESKKANVPAGQKKKFKDVWYEFMNYKAPVEPLSQIEMIQQKVNNQMDIIIPEKRANDFLVVGNKLYVLLLPKQLSKRAKSKTQIPVPGRKMWKHSNSISLYPVPAIMYLNGLQRMLLRQMLRVVSLSVTIPSRVLMPVTCQPCMSA